MDTVSHKQEDLERAERQGMPLAATLSLAASALVPMLAIGGHVFVAQRQLTLWGVLLFALASVLFLGAPVRAGAAALWRPTGQDAQADQPRPLVRQPVLRVAFLINSLLLAGVAYWAFAGNRLDRGFWFWVVALLYYAVSQLERPEAGWRQSLQGWRQAVDVRLLLALMAIVGVAVFFRLFRLAGVPAEMTSDHAEKLLDVYDVLNGARPLFFVRNTGREAFQFYWTAALIALTPLQLGHLALKVGTVIFGILTVPATYLLGAELYGRRVGLLAAFLLAISHWHVTISRIGLRFPFTAAFATPALYFLFRALRRNRRNDWLAVGAFLGLGLHTYTAMRIVPLLFVMLVLTRAGYDVLVSLRKHSERRGSEADRLLMLAPRFWGNAVRSATMVLLLFTPLLRYMADNPEGFWYRTLSRAQADMPVGELWATFWQNLVDVLLMFNYRGDVVPMNTVPESAVLGPVTGGMFVLGVGYLLWRLVSRHELRAFYVLTSFIVMLLPSVLSLAFPRENPSVVRTGGAIPFVMIIAALPLVVLLGSLRQVRAGRYIGPGLLLLLLAGAVVFNYRWYFDVYDTNIRRSLWNATEMGAALREFESRSGQLQNAYHVPYPHWVDTRNIAINAADITWHNTVNDLSEIAHHAELPGRKLYLVDPAHEAALRVLQEVYPQGEARLQPSERPGKQFILFEVPAADGNS